MLSWNECIIFLHKVNFCKLFATEYLIKLLISFPADLDWFEYFSFHCNLHEI